jgi:hypothetical protein
MSVSYRELYAPAHFGNSYEVMWPREMKDVLSEARFWGFNVYGDWFDASDLKNPYNNPTNEYMLGQALWDRKMASYESARDLGFKLNLAITPNHVYLDQLAPDLLAEASDKRFFGQLLCPSNASARAIILADYRELFSDLTRREIQLDSLTAFAFDYGGCSCSRCSPWILTFGSLFAEVHDLALTFFPSIQARLSGWWWTQEEHAAFKEWADSHTPGRFRSLASFIPSGGRAPQSNLPLPHGCARHAFVHMGYSDKAQPRDEYGLWGPVVAVARIPETVAQLAVLGYDGYMAYSEGVFDDINKALLAGLSSRKFAGVADVLEAYADRYFGAGPTDRKAWAYWISEWSEAFGVDTAGARAEFDRLARGARPSWRLAQLEAKLALFEAHAEVERSIVWDASRLAAADRFYDVRERMQRGIWGLGLTRHVMNENYRAYHSYHRPRWYESWKAHVKTEAT